VEDFRYQRRTTKGRYGLEQPDGQPEQTYVPASYVKWIEGGGARVIPIHYRTPKAELDELLSSLNGMVFTGGCLSLEDNTTYYQTAKYIYEKAIEFNENGDYFPIWGTCMGFQLLTILGAQDHSVLLSYAFDSENLPLPLLYTPEAANSRLFGNAPTNVVTWLSDHTLNVTINLHHDGILPTSYYNNQNLRTEFKLLSYNYDRVGKAFGSTIEGHKHPFYGVQYHPERNQYEWDTPEAVSHAPQAIACAQYFSEFFVEECRKSAHTFSDSKTEQSLLIYQYSPTYTGGDDDSFPEQQTYYFMWK